MAEQLPINFAVPSEGAIASYNWIDLEAGFGYVDYYLCSSDDGTIYKRTLTTTAVPSSEASISTSANYYFISSVLNSPKTIEGTAYFGTFADYASSTGISIGAKLSIFDARNADTSEGEVQQTDATEYQSDNGGSWKLVKTYSNINDYLHGGTMELKSNGASTAYARHVIYFKDGQTHTEEWSQVDTTYVEKTWTNPYPLSKVDKVELYLSANSIGGVIAYGKNNTFYELTTDPVVTDITDKVTSRAVTADTGVLIGLEVPKTDILIGQQLFLEVTKAGGVGTYSIDPLGLINTNQPSILSLPYRIIL